jgi:4-diphosphocytidyl-2-C-methyl-D-erythritol kinase
VIRVESFAKINRSLVVLGRRSDGYHELDTIYQTIDLTDLLEFERAERVTLQVDEPGLSCGEDNLVMKAARALQGDFSVASGARITLKKRIPIGGGLGGGSSNAAATLTGLSALWKLSPSSEKLQGIAARLGSDVAFFLVGGTARGRGHGERIEPLPDLPDARAAILLVPPFSLATADVYQALEAPSLPPSLTGEGWDTNLRGSDPGSFPNRNDLEPAAESIRGELRSLRQALVRAGALSARLSGSGSSVFGLFRDLSTAKRAASGLGELPPGTSIRIVPTVSRLEFTKRASPRITE